MRLCALYSDLGDSDWPDSLDSESGQFTYYGDNKTHGSLLHETRRGGNIFLRDIFDRLHSGRRQLIPPILVFTKAARGRDVVFRGLAVPGAAGMSQTDDLVAIWKSKAGHRFQNYRSVFTILDVPTLERNWIDLVKAGRDASDGAPKPWLDWRSAGRYAALRAPRALQHRTPDQQLPGDAERLTMLRDMVTFFDTHPEGKYAFERCAAELFRMMDSNVASLDLTRKWRDGGRDAIAKYRIGGSESCILINFALEAKCKTPSPRNGSGVRDTTRLIARLRHREFGVFVTTSCVSLQAYQEIVEDAHPVLILSGIDVAEILISNGVSRRLQLLDWLKSLA